MIAFCKDKQRRNLILQTPRVNGLDYLEVLGMPGCGDQLALTFINDVRGLTLTPANISLTGGTVLQVTGVAPASNEDPLTITVYLSGTGDFSPYTLRLVKSPTNADPAPGIDPQLNTVTFSFKAGCPAIADCQQQQCCPSDLATPPDIHYLARDYDTIRQAMLDRIMTLVPGWTETHEADPRHHAGRGIGLRGRPHQLLAGCGKHGGLHRYGAQPHLTAPTRAPRQLPGERRGEYTDLDLPVSQFANQSARTDPVLSPRAGTSGCNRSY
jgi:hypothetical protein